MSVLKALTKLKVNLAYSGDDPWVDDFLSTNQNDCGLLCLPFEDN
jgi:hypothetical protein